MVHAKRGTRLLSGSALALAAALAVAGCTPAPSASSPASGSAAGTASALTASQASQVFSASVAVSDTAARTGDAKLALSGVTGAQWSVVSAELQAAKQGHTALERYAYATPTFYLPRPDGYPRWFVASVERTRTAPLATAPTEIIARPAGARLPARERVLMVFEQTGRTSPWLLASTAELTGASLPPLSGTQGGYIATVPASTTTLLAPPDIAGPLQAAVVDDGPASPAAKEVADGMLTTGIYGAERASLLGLAAPPGDVYRWELEGSDYQQFSLRTADGGALVLYTMYLNNTVEVPAVLNNAEPVKAGPLITVPSGLRPLLPAGTAAPREKLEAQQLLSFAAVDPPSGNGKIQVIAIGGGLNYAAAS